LLSHTSHRTPKDPMKFITHSCQHVTAATSNNQTDIIDRGNTNDTEDFKISGSQERLLKIQVFWDVIQSNLNMEALWSYEMRTSAHSVTQ